ncbi:MAG: bifunctional 5,10-methylenetetrahydrofolate dehydrogenase/5,10-methenyltetrahydrofolate cyclohydrolase [Alphaproteobacteria bacterium]|nr:bifunctional 5,10-methylenetetrahydrofolate dehydrogenase/5,10-methenyltetrahydrofolate cyclohydrolase [Alphaproteobacteria bacterium]
MTAEIIDGRKTAQEIRSQLKQAVAGFSDSPKLAVVLVGRDEASVIYVRNKEKAAAEVGIGTDVYRLAEDVSEKQVLQLIDRLNEDVAVNGIIVQLPLPAHLNVGRIIGRISPLKDVDGFHPYNTGLLQNNEKPYFVAATPLGVLKLIHQVCPVLSGKNVVLIGASLIVGRPLATLLLNQECTVSITHVHTQNIKNLTQNADIIVAACGVARMVKKDWIKPEAVLIDVGINRENGRICGDVDFDDEIEKAAAVTPVPGGVGPMTIAMLLKNTVDAYKLQHNI